MKVRDEAAAPRADVARVATRIASIVVVASAVGVLVGMFGRPGLIVDLSHPIPIHSGSSLSCLLLALALLGWLGAIPMGPRARVACIGAGVVVAGSAILAASSGLHDVAAGAVAHGEFHRHAVPSLTATCVVLLALALLGRERDWPISLTDSLACLSFAISSFVLFSWGIGNPDAIAIGHEEPPYFLGALAFAVLAVAVILADPERHGLGAMLARRGGAGGTVLRRLVPVALLVPLGLEVARHQLEGALDVDLVATTQVFATAVLLFAIVLLGAVLLDRSERELHAAREAAFMSTMSHELRTPLIAIRNLAEVVEHGWDDVGDDLKRATNRATLEQSTRLLDLIHDTWQLRRLDAGILPARGEVVALHDALKSAVAERGIPMGVECPSSLRVWIDPEHLRLMLGACLRLAQRSAPEPRPSVP